MTKRRLSEDVLWGLKWGLSAALFFTAWVSFVRVSSGSEPFEEMEVTYSGVVTLYVLVGIVGGALLGALRPLTGSKWGAALLGWFLAFITYSAAAALIDAPPWEWDSFLWVLFIVLAGVLGVPSGFLYWSRAQNHD
jgi:hypothetical protein